MPKESFEAKRRRAVEIFDRLDAQMPNAEIELRYQDPFQLLVAVILSAQCTDKRVNLVTPGLFKRFPTPAAMARARTGEVEKLIQSCGLFRSKAKNLIAASQALVAEHGGAVPSSRDVLVTLPGVGTKTAGVVCMHLEGDRAFPVDTHIQRLSLRLGLTLQTHPDKVERDLQALLPSDRWKKGHQLLIWHGRRTCYARSPACDSCVVRALCPRIGVAKR
jgi:endonuclease III